MMQQNAHNQYPAPITLTTGMLFSAVVDGPSLTVLYGPSGSGKTRLFRHMEELLHNVTDCNVFRCCTGDLINRLLDSLKHGAHGEFISSLRTHRVLLIDNIWILGHRVNTAREMFRIFRLLIQYGGSVVIASDLKPSVISSWSKEIGEMIEQSRIIEICSAPGTDLNLSKTRGDRVKICPRSEKRLDRGWLIR